MSTVKVHDTLKWKCHYDSSLYKEHTLAKHFYKRKKWNQQVAANSVFQNSETICETGLTERRLICYHTEKIIEIGSRTFSSNGSEYWVQQYYCQELFFTCLGTCRSSERRGGSVFWESMRFFLRYVIKWFGRSLACKY